VKFFFLLARSRRFYYLDFDVNVGFQNGVRVSKHERHTPLQRKMTRVLVVDDFDEWRRFVSVSLKQEPGFDVIAEVSDGFEAVEKVQELQPDLIVLDVGLPGLSGIEAAKLIGELAPRSRILFLTQNRTPEVAGECFGVGASGYVVKADAGKELLIAAQTVVQGKHFVSTSVAASVPAG
jgi:DNA-binding NarL/FixJ family response regulator